ncbi:MAG: TetR/AcrR family transcriptional regulator [Alphaproteobacteria bacterium]|nr:MAG: TetR/AcrR family transcriptional regulator [Alphaproteobacteria bacterium]
MTSTTKNRKFDDALTDERERAFDAAGTLEGTKLRIVTAAERLFATYGIDGVTLQQILKGAGQRNSSAMHYHFGTKDALIEAILAWRMTGIDIHRNRMIDGLLKDGYERDIRAILATGVIPFTRPTDESSQPSYYNRFLLEIHRNPGFSFDELIAGKFDRGIQRMSELLYAQLSTLPDELRKPRIATIRAMIIYGVADIEALRSKRLQEKRDFDLRRAVENLIDMASGALIAPVSKETCERLTAPSGKI